MKLFIPMICLAVSVSGCVKPDASFSRTRSFLTYGRANTSAAAEGRERASAYDEKRREAIQGSSSRFLSEADCLPFLNQITPKGRVGDIEPSEVDGTPQERLCVAEYNDTHGRKVDAFPGWLPDGVTARPVGNGYWNIYQH